MAELSAAAWSARYDTASVPWDMGACSPPLCWLDQQGRLPYGRVLVPGCGAGHEVAYLARRGYDVVGLDFAASAAEAARRRVAEYPSARVEAFDVLDPRTYRLLRQFDWVFDQTFFCSLPPARRGEYATAMRCALHTGGELIALSFRTVFDDRPPFDITPEAFTALLTGAGFELRESRLLDLESHPARRGRETLVRAIARHFP